MAKLTFTKEGEELLEKIFDLPYKLPRNDVGIIWPFPSRLVIEPRKADGSLDVARIGADKLATLAGKIHTARALSDLFFTHNQDAKHASGQDIMDWLCDNGLVARAKTW
jgi:hypothetical protein